ncbi:MAG TPA: hypothetical protein VD788_16960 [Candidatus Polarisedimenticolaceae bacterium]|nr:hypothetical protein [Candidatus Polarisedimenticolaceae bacterium]
MTTTRSATVVATIVLATCCGYVQRGSWTDDPRNWYRIFGEAKPDEVTLVHSFYERLPGFRMRYRFYLAFEAPAEARERLVARLSLSPLPHDLAPTDAAGADPARPAWFAPGDPGDYRIWIDAPNRRLRMFVNPDTGATYLSDRRS